jgi:NHL repeat
VRHWGNETPWEGTKVRFFSGAPTGITPRITHSSPKLYALSL